MPTSSGPGISTAVIEETHLDRRLNPTDGGDHERFSHFVPKADLMDAMVNGHPVVALCGKVWVPSRDPERFPICPDCKDIYEGLGTGDDE